jgi:hypothetical protein
MWPQPRPAVSKVQYGSPLVLGLLVDLQTFLLGSGVGTGVVGMAALLRWAWGFDLDLGARRAQGRAAIAEGQAREELAKAEGTEAKLRRARAERELHGLERVEHLSVVSRPQRAREHSEQDLIPLDREIAALAGEGGFASLARVQQDAKSVEAVARRGRIPNRLLPLTRAVDRLARLRHSWRPEEIRLRRPDPEENQRFGLPHDGAPPHLPDLGDEAR